LLFDIVDVKRRDARAAVLGWVWLGLMDRLLDVFLERCWGFGLCWAWIFWA
jgi:hypothetical protein